MRASLVWSSRAEGTVHTLLQSGQILTVYGGLFASWIAASVTSEPLLLLLLLLTACPKAGAPSLGVTLVLTEPGSVEPTRVMEPRLERGCAVALPFERGLTVVGREPEVEVQLREERRSASDYDRSIMVRMGDAPWTTVGDSSFTVMSVGRTLNGVLHTGVLTPDGRRNLAVSFNLPSC